MMRFAWSFFLLFLTACADRGDIAIRWEAQKAVAIVIPQHLLPNFSKDSLHLLQVRLNNNTASILGDYTVADNAVEFTPLIPFTRGLTYQIIWKGDLVQQIAVQGNATLQKPEVVSIYPSGDTLPENLLKMYVVFSKPMREGQALQNIAVIKNGRDTVPSIFLDLEPELWNRERNILTIWLDPGRIKRDLQPNKTLGAPLQAGNSYEIIVKPGWEDVEGTSLASAYRTHFVAAGRDSRSPDPAWWIIHAPQAGTNNALTVELHEPLDYLVLKNAISIIDNTGKLVSGTIETRSKETIFHFTP